MISHRQQRTIDSFLTDDSSVVDIPMYLVVTLIIGLVVLASILSMIFLPSLTTETPLVFVEPLLSSINTSTGSIQYHVRVTTPTHQPMVDAHVIIKNQQSIATNSTNESGQTIVSIQVRIPQGLQETYFDVIVKSNRYQTLTNTNMLKVILG